MPYSDNLYSANDDESDDESFSNELSPTDGFFNRNAMSPNHMVSDPSLDRKDRAEEDKVLIPRNETRNESGSASRSTTSPTLGQLFPSQNYASSQSNNRPMPPPTSSNIPSSPVSPRRTDNNLFTERNHSMQGPPPAYTPSSPTTSSHSTPNNSSSHNRSYSTFEPHRVEQGLAPEPQSMGRPEDDPDESTPLAYRPIRKPSRRRLIVKKLLFLALVTAVGIGIMTTLVNWGKAISKKDPKSPGGEIPVGKEPPSLGLPDDSSGRPYCTSAIYHAGETFFDFALDKGLAVVQTTYDTDYGRNGHIVQTSGVIRLRKMPKDSKYSSRGLIQMDINVSDEDLQILKTWDDNTRIMKITTPKYAPMSSSRTNDCISLEVTVWLPEDASLTSLSIASETLALRVVDDIKIKVTGDADFVSVIGDVIFPNVGARGEAPPDTYPLDSRHITVETVTGNIKGIYPLYDYLKLGSQTGDIAVGVYPQPGLPAAPAPAELEVGTSSGQIQVTFPAQIPRYDPPARDYVSQVASVSGGISGTYFLGSVASFKSSSGDMTVKIQPVIPYSPSTDPDDAPKSHLDTFGMSGDHEFAILTPTFISLPTTSKPDEHESPYIPIGDDDPYRHILPPDLNEDAVLEQRSVAASKVWRTLKSNHQSNSGGISVYYPDGWEGTVSERSVSGDIKADGKDLKILSYKKGWAYKELVAGNGVDKKGDGSSAGMTSVSGDLNFTVG